MTDDFRRAHPTPPPAPEAKPAPEPPEPVPARSEPGPPSSATGWRLIGRFQSDYALFETGSGLTILRLRAASERIWFERLKATFGSDHPARQQLLFPLPLEFEPRAAAAIAEHLDWLRARGFELEEFGRNFYRLEAHPDWLPAEQAEPFVRDLADRLREGQLDPARTDLAAEQLAKLATARAARLEVELSDAAVEKLAAALLACEHPLADPKGRPTLIELDRPELRKRFGLG